MKSFNEAQFGYCLLVLKFHEYWIEKSITDTSAYYDLYIETAEVHFTNYRTI